MKKFTHRFIGSLSDIESLPASGGAFIPSKDVEVEVPKQSSVQKVSVNLLQKLLGELVADLKKEGRRVLDSYPAKELLYNSKKILNLFTVELAKNISQPELEDILSNSAMYQFAKEEGHSFKIDFLLPSGELSLVVTPKGVEKYRG